MYRCLPGRTSYYLQRATDSQAVLRYSDGTSSRSDPVPSAADGRCSGRTAAGSRRCACVNIAGVHIVVIRLVTPLALLTVRIADALTLKE